MFISVVVAVKDERPFIRRCVEALSRQDYDGYEVVVVDGMSEDGTWELLEELQDEHGFRLLRNPKVNAAAGRNRGVAVARGDVVAFVDGDAVPADDWLCEIQRALERCGDDVAGVGGPDLLPGDSVYKSRAIGRVMTSPLASGGQLNPSTQHTMDGEGRFVDHIPTCNLALRRGVLDDVGLFDEGFVKGQDLELNFRLRRAGYRLWYSPCIRVVHYRKRHVRHFARQIYKWAKAKVAIVRKHGMHGLLSHVYLWPVYGLLGLLAAVALCVLGGAVDMLLVLLFFAGMLYALLVVFESGRLSWRFRDLWLLPYALLLLPTVHVSYGFGALSAVFRRRIW